MDSEEPPNVRVACSGDIDEVVRLMHDAAAWMSAKGTPGLDEPVLQVLNLVFQAPVNHLELLALLLPVFGGALLVGGTSENGK
mgnify:CR=1 FL=1